MHRILGVAKHYDWGDPTFIPGLLGREPDDRCWAELWFGTHPSGPSQLLDGRPLRELTGDLPYLLKVIAAARPLSLQLHPDAERARVGHAAGRYPDPFPKPEILVALTPFEALSGFRVVEATAELFDELGLEDAGRILATSGPTAVLEALYRREVDPVAMIDACIHSERPEASWARRLDLSYPGDPSVAATLLLNLVRLEPGEWIELPAGTLHAYLLGAGIELMGASDNVVRGGLTTKPVDVDDMLDLVDPVTVADPRRPVTNCYPLADTGIALRRVDPGDDHVATTIEIALGLDGHAMVLEPPEHLRPEITTYVVTRPTATR